MLESYLALIDRFGLRTLVKEDAESPSNVSQAITRLGHANCILIWTVLSRQSAESVRKSIESGEGKRALQILELNAERIGIIDSPAIGKAA